MSVVRDVPTEFLPTHTDTTLVSYACTYLNLGSVVCTVACGECACLPLVYMSFEDHILTHWFALYLLCVRRQHTFSLSLSSSLLSLLSSSFFNHSPPFLHQDQGSRLWVERSGLCWQGCGGVSWAVVPSGGNRLAARREGPVKDTLLGIGLSQCLVQMTHTHINTHSGRDW